MRVIAELRSGRVHVSELARRLGMSRPLLYMHLGNLEKAGIVIVLLVVFILPRLTGVDPLGQALESVLPWAFRTVFWLAGRDVDGMDGNFI